MKPPYPMLVDTLPEAAPRERRVYFEVFGCQMNKLDSELMLESLVARGYQLTHDSDEASVILYNTCSIREHAEERAISRLQTFRKRKESEPDLVLGLLGCVAQHKEAELFKRMPYLDMVVGTREFDQLPELIDAVRAGDEPRLATEMDSPLVFSRRRNLGPQPWHAYVSVMRGCDMVCTYCIVPTTRGKEVSRPPEVILDEIRRLAGDGVRELTLLGQTVNSYGKRLGPGIGLDTLLRGIEEINGIERVRFITSHPRFMRPKLIDAMAECSKVTDFLHLPVQSGSNAVLARMKRTYDRDFYLKVIERLRDKMPNLHLLTDFIVGFPGETEAEFEESMSLVDAADFDYGYVFMYSPRPGTVSHRLADDIAEEEKKRRLHTILHALEENGRRRNLDSIGRRVEVLVEGVSKFDASRMAGRARDFRMVVFPASPLDRPGSFVEVEVESTTAGTLLGRRIGPPGSDPVMPPTVRRAPGSGVPSEPQPPRRPAGI